MTGSPSLPAGETAVGASRVGRIQVTLITSVGCHFCREIDLLLSNLEQRYPLDIERVDLTSAEGAALARRFRVPFPPLLLIEGEFHAHGRISERRLTRALTLLVDGEE